MSPTNYFARSDQALLSRSFASTGRSWLNPGGNLRKCTLLANVLVMRLLYMHLGHWLHSPEVTKNWCSCSRNILMLSHYSWDCGTHGSGEYISWLSSQCPRCWPQVFVPGMPTHGFAHHNLLGPCELLQVMFAWGPMQQFLAACSARTGTLSVTVYHASFLFIPFQVKLFPCLQEVVGHQRHQSWFVWHNLLWG